jgi:hypothetical protein
MKNLILGAILLFSVMTFGQKRHGLVHTNGASVTADSTATTSTKWNKYVAVGISISNGNTYDTNTNAYTFQESAYPSVEFGFSRENLSLSGVIGRGNFQGLGSHADGIGNYYWEVKATPTFPLGVVNASLIFGAGTYFNNQVGNGFIEYGSGISYTVGKFTYGVCYTNWDGIDYITPNVSFSLD